MKAAWLLLLATATVALAAPAARRPVRVSDALCVSQSDGPFLALPAAARDAYLDAMAAAGWKWLRTDVTWSRVEPAPPPAPFDFSRYDELIDQARARDVRVLGIVDYGVDWAAAAAPAGDDRYPPDDPEAFARFAGEAARRYRGRVSAWEIWNEPNNSLSAFWKPAPDPAAYARLAKVAARAIRRADRKATIVTGGLAPTFDLLLYQRDYAFFSEATRADKRWLQKFGAAALHPYTYLQAPAPEQENLPLGPSVTHQMRNFRDRLTESHATRLPLWLTELGWHTAPDSGSPLFPPGVSELDQARFLVRSTVLALSQLAERVCWYTLLDHPSFLTDKEAAFGLFRYQAAPAAGALDPKPAYQAAATLGRVLGPTRYLKDVHFTLNLPPEGYAFAFTASKPPHSVIVLWATRDGVPMSTLVGPSVSAVHRIEMDGTQTDLGKPDSLDLTLGPTPFYLVFDGS